MVKCPYCLATFDSSNGKCPYCLAIIDAPIEEEVITDEEEEVANEKVIEED